MFVKKLFALKTLLLPIGLLISTTSLKAQFHIGPEIGGAISAMVPSNQKIPNYAQRIGLRVGGFVEMEISSLFAIRSGLFYTLRGFNFGTISNPYNEAKFWDIHGLNIPMMFVLKLGDQVQMALGLEMNNVLGSNLPLIRLPSIQMGLRGECGFQINNQLRVSAYYMHGFNKLLEIRTSRPGQNDFYNNIIAGISVAYIAQSFYKKSKPSIEICPPFL